MSLAEILATWLRYAYYVGPLPFLLVTCVIIFVLGVMVSWVMEAVTYLRHRGPDLEDLERERERNFREVCAKLETQAKMNGWVTNTVH